MFHSLFRVVLPLLVLVGCGWMGWWLLQSKPAPKVMEIPAPLLRVEGQTLKKAVYPVVARSQGTVQPRMRTILTTEVAGRIIEMSSQFRPGGFFDAGEVLVRLDPLDFETALVMAKAALAQSQAILEEEKARAEQALEGWKSLGRKGEPNPLLARAPQLLRAEADVAAADAQVKKAERDLQRTELRAVYPGQVLRQDVDLGQVVSAGSNLGEVFATDSVEVRLPVPEREMRHLELPQLHRAQDRSAPGAVVRLLAMEGGRSTLWEGHLVRVEGEIDAATRQTIAVAEIRDPYAARDDGLPPLKIGQFVEAEILGLPLTDVFLVPRVAVRAGNEIVLITPENRLHRVHVEPLAGDAKHVVISSQTEEGPKEGDVLCVTPIPFPAEGARVLPTIDGMTERPGVAGAEGAHLPETKRGKRPGGRES